MRTLMMRTLVFSLVACCAHAALAQPAPSAAVRTEVLRAVVQVKASGCSDGTSRTGSGFLFESSGRIVTAHHVVGGCSLIQVRYEGIAAPAKRIYDAQLVRVLPSGDLGLLEVASAPALPTLRLATATISADGTYAGFGYPLGVPTAGDQPVTLAVGATRLKDILPDEAARELMRSGSRIVTDTDVLRLNVALQPGMSGGAHRGCRRRGGRHRRRGTESRVGTGQLGLAEKRCPAAAGFIRTGGHNRSFGPDSLFVFRPGAVGQRATHRAAAEVR
jgi:S1-C subfamily serine protease